MKYEELIEILEKELKEVYKFYFMETYLTKSLVGPFKLITRKSMSYPDHHTLKTIWYFLDHNIYVEVTGIEALVGLNHKFLSWKEACQQVWPFEEIATVYKNG